VARAGQPKYAKMFKIINIFKLIRKPKKTKNIPDIRGTIFPGLGARFPAPGGRPEVPGSRPEILKQIHMFIGFETSATLFKPTIFKRIPNIFKHIPNIQTYSKYSKYSNIFQAYANLFKHIPNIQKSHLGTPPPVIT